MPDSNTNLKSKNQNPPELSTPPAVLLTFRKPLIILAHIVAFAASLMLSFLLTKNMRLERSWLVEQYLLLLLFFLIIKLVIFGLFKQYRGWWRYVGITDLFGIAGASLVSTLIIVALWFTMLNTTSVRRALVNLTEVSQGVFMADMFATILLLAGLRMIIRLYHEEFRTVEAGRLKRFLIVGAGNAGEALLREIHRMPVAQYDVIGFIDDDPSRQGINIHGIPILGTVEQLPKICKDRNIEEIAIAISIKTIICNITDKIRVDEIFEKYKPQIVIHAAAHKHVPLMELNPGEAIKNNVVGTQVVADAADNYGAANVVMISTDKAVNPTSIMGSSKRIAEMYIQDLNRTSKTHFVTVRFGNVLGSDGSVVPIFKKQIVEGGPVTVTHPMMKRYFMTIPEASQLVLQAATMGKGGEIFVLDMGEPVKIVDLAKELITLSGFRPGEDIEIAFTNPRPGEKLFEELSLDDEDMQRTRHPKISIWKNIPMDRDKLHTGINELLTIAQTQNHRKIVQKIKELVPEYMGGNNQNAETIED